MHKIKTQFAIPPKNCFPKIRYWLPEAAVETSIVLNDLSDLKERGFYGVEIIPFMNNGIKQVGSDKRWGTEKWHQLIAEILRHSRKIDLKIDFSIGPKWPIAMPEIKNADTEGSLFELTYGCTKVNSSETKFLIPLKKTNRNEGTSCLIALSAYKYLGNNRLDEDSYIDLLPFLDESNVLNYTFLTKNEEWIIFSFWEQPATQMVGNKWYVVDHFSREGTKACEQYWLGDIGKIIKKYPDVVESLFCDSLEYDVSCEWTRGLLAIFEKEKGYSLLPYLPIIGEKLTYPRNIVSEYTFKDTYLVTKVNNDFKSLLTKLYLSNHLLPLENLAKELGMNLRYQVSYNKPIQVEEAAGVVSVPEGESFGRISIDNLRTMSGAVHIKNKRLYSFEGSAEIDNSYGQTFEDLLWWIKRASIGGVNTQVIHGAAYSGENEIQLTEWPGYESFGRRVSNYWNRTLSPAQMKDYMTNIARMNFILQKKHIVDLAIYRHEYLNTGKGGDGNHILKDGGRLINKGFSYDFVSPSLLEDEKAVVSNKRLASSGPNYKALIIPYQKEICLKGLREIQRLAKSELPVFFVGTFPTKHKFQSEENVQQEKIIRALRKNENVFLVENYEQLEHKFKEMKIKPDVEFESNQGIATVHTKDVDGDYYYLYNYNAVEFGYYPKINSEKKIFNPDTIYPTLNRFKNFKNKQAKITLKGDQPPLVLDLNTGDIKKIFVKEVDGRYTFDLTFNKDEAKIIFLPQKNNVNLDNLEYVENSFVKKGNIIELNYWELTTQKIIPAKNSCLFKDFSWEKEALFHLSSPLPSWINLDETFRDFAGKGTYRHEFTINEVDKSMFKLNIDQVSDSYSIFINEKKLSPMLFYKFDVDITKYLKNGKNKLEIVVYSNLYNYLNQEQKKDYGLIGNVSIEEYKMKEGLKK